MRKILLVFFTFHCSLLTTLAQTAVSTYLPGVTPEGAIYLLPKTGIRIAVQVEKTTYAPGELCKYAERYLRIKDVSPTPSVNYRITDIRQEAYAVADTSKHQVRRQDSSHQCPTLRRWHPPRHQYRPATAKQISLHAPPSTLH